MPDIKKPGAGLPIHDVETQIIAAVSSPGALVLTAPTGSGKTTQVPQFLYEAGFGFAQGSPGMVGIGTSADHAATEGGGDQAPHTAR